MKKNNYQSFSQNVARYIFYSAFITVVSELIFIYYFNQWTKNRQISNSRITFTNEVVSNTNIPFQITIFVLFGISVFIIAFLIFLHRSMNYLREISKGVQYISEGNLDIPIPEVGDGEFTNIARSLNKMTTELKILMEKERVIEKTKNDLITNVAHDLRTPLTSIIGYLNLIRDNASLNEKEKQNYLDIVYNKSKRLEYLIKDLFGYVKLNHEKVDMQIGSLDLVKLLGQLLEEFYPSFKEKDLECDFIHTEASIIIEADGNLLARLFENLISNAIKYGADGKLIKVLIIKTEVEIIVNVINYGTVIPREQWGDIFEKFYRLDSSRTGNTGGTGLGLAIAKTIAEIHGGSITVKSDIQGTEFQVTLYPTIPKKIN